MIEIQVIARTGRYRALMSSSFSLFTATLVLGVVTACGGGNAGTATTRSTGVTTPPSAPMIQTLKTPRDACALLTRRQIAAVAPALSSTAPDLILNNEPARGDSECQWSVPEVTISATMSHAPKAPLLQFLAEESRQASTNVGQVEPITIGGASAALVSPPGDAISQTVTLYFEERGYLFLVGQNPTWHTGMGDLRAENIRAARQLAQDILLNVG